MGFNSGFKGLKAFFHWLQLYGLDFMLDFIYLFIHSFIHLLNTDSVYFPFVRYKPQEKQGFKAKSFWGDEHDFIHN